jgi:hypothetical protein
VNAIAYAASIMVLALLAAPLAAAAQPGKVYRVGYVTPGPGIEPTSMASLCACGRIVDMKALWRRVAPRAAPVTVT